MTTKRLLGLLIFASAMVLSCNDDDNGPNANVNLNFFAKYNGQPLVFQQTYEYTDGHKLLIQRLNFYISNVSLLDADGHKVELLDIDFLDFTDNTTLTEAQNPLTFTATQIPAGAYTGLQIGIGVPANLNNQEANKLPIGNPLRDTYNSQFWSDWGSFIFLKSEGIYDNDNDGAIENNGDDNPFGHHCGTNESYVLLNINKPIKVEANETLDLNFSVDWLQLYNHDSGMHDFSDPTKLYTHNPNDLTLAKQIMSNFAKALTLE